MLHIQSFFFLLYFNHVRISVIRNESFGGVVFEDNDSELPVSSKAVFPRNLLDDVRATVTVLQTYLVADVECVLHIHAYQMISFDKASSSASSPHLLNITTPYGVNWKTKGSSLRTCSMDSV